MGPEPLSEEQVKQVRRWQANFYAWNKMVISWDPREKYFLVTSGSGTWLRHHGGFKTNIKWAWDMAMNIRHSVFRNAEGGGLLLRSVTEKIPVMIGESVLRMTEEDLEEIGDDGRKIRMQLLEDYDLLRVAERT